MHCAATARGHVRERHAVDVRDEVHVESAPAILGERLHDHHDAEIGPADADVDDVRDRLARVAAQRDIDAAFRIEDEARIGFWDALIRAGRAPRQVTPR
jgi:hypothetical protein